MGLNWMPIRMPMFGTVGSDKTHCKPFDLLIPEQWVFGYTLWTYSKAIRIYIDEDQHPEVVNRVGLVNDSSL